MGTIGIAIIVVIALVVGVAFVAGCFVDWPKGSEDAAAIQNYLDPTLWIPGRK